MNEKRPRCSIVRCPWKAKYSFGTMGCYECWFHYEDMPLINWAWDLFCYPIKKLFFWIRLRFCGTHPKGALLYHFDPRFLLIPRLRNVEDE